MCGDGVCQNSKGEDHVNCKADCGWKGIAAGFRATCALRNDKTVWCWGTNELGDLGNNTAVGLPVPLYSTKPVRVTGLGGVIAITGKFHHFCALKSTGLVHCWGRAQYGELGDGKKVHTKCTANDYCSPVPVKVLGLENAKLIRAGSWNSCALDAGGELTCWGHNASGQLAGGPVGFVYAPVKVPVKDLVDLGVGHQHMCGRHKTGGVSCWGNNHEDWLGLGPGKKAVATPAPVLALSGVSHHDAGQTTSCAVVNGAVFCWGSNSHGQLGIGNWSGPLKNKLHGFAISPQAVQNLTNIVEVFNTRMSAFALSKSGEVWAWGGNSESELGVSAGPTPCLNVSACSTKPQKLEFPMGVKIAVLSGGCAIDTSGAAWCWGPNKFGRVGDGTTVTRAAPVQVLKKY